MCERTVVAPSGCGAGTLFYPGEQHSRGEEQCEQRGQELGVFRIQIAKQEKEGPIGTAQAGMYQIMPKVICHDKYFLFLSAQMTTEDASSRRSGACLITWDIYGSEDNETEAGEM